MIITCGSQNVQWEHGKACEDRVHSVIFEEHGFVFVGIYDGFSGPNATDFLLNNLYPNVYKELKGLLWFDKSKSCENTINSQSFMSKSLDTKERVELDRKLREKLSNLEVDVVRGNNIINHLGALKALSEALRKTEASYLDRCTSVKEEVRRIRTEHPDDPLAVFNERVKGSLKVTRAFGAGFLKQMITCGLGTNSFALSRILAFYSDPFHGSLSYGYKIFEQIQNPTNCIFNTMIKACLLKDEYIKSIQIFKDMMRNGICPDNYTLSYVLKTGAKMKRLDLGELIHGFDFGYAKIGNVYTTRLVFDEVPLKDRGIWGAMISGYVQNNCFKEGLQLFKLMQLSGNKPDEAIEWQ
ncbi:unnamed protein product [Fraxinus pennsylvanica]|uniref:PPM-type phosphatase domain-containing protein n=1 Tax=Fraxinus pennsylvanica TaxID=56036 RepID=A0AAD2E155_9LAMI|nr:unnamed protein product [Fraxinus pennsylvanica]